MSLGLAVQSQLTFGNNSQQPDKNFETEKEGLRRLLEEKYEIKPNSGHAPRAIPNSSQQKTWIYPADKTFRTYQFQIVRSGLFENTLVTLPTGLGKTFIASTVMYNYYRWFMDGLIFFLAPTKPLVMQQTESFTSTISEVPLDDICELMGTTSKDNRKKAYKMNRVFFMTPQTLEKDMYDGCVPFDRVVLIVLDEAHRATGNYAYCKLIQKMEEQKTGFRILALSATPVSKIENLPTIIQSLRTCKLEVRDEDDDEVKKYTYDKNIIEVYVEKDDSLEQLGIKIDAMMELCLKFLKQARLLSQDTKAKFVNKMTVLNLQEEVQNKAQQGVYAIDFVGVVMTRTGALMNLCHAKKLLKTHGYQAFADYFLNLFDFKEEKKEKKNKKFLKELHNTDEYRQAETFLQDSLASKNHPKLRKLAEILDKFFLDPKNVENQSKVIIFSQFRDSAKEIKNYLDNKTDNIVKAEIFVGQNNGGLSQKMQKAMIHKFKTGSCNTLIATCVAEEGLDIGDVNLIISYDCLASPIRMVQRFGRTGRAGSGSVIVLIAKGEEENKYKQSKVISKNIMNVLKNESSKQTKIADKNGQTQLSFGQKQSNKQQQSNPLGVSYYGFNPRMIPDEIHSLPVYRQLAQRPEQEKKKIECQRLKNLPKRSGAKPRKSQSLQPTKVKKQTKGNTNNANTNGRMKSQSKVIADNKSEVQDDSDADEIYIQQDLEQEVTQKEILDIQNIIENSRVVNMQDDQKDDDDDFQLAFEMVDVSSYHEETEKRISLDSVDQKLFMLDQIMASKKKSSSKQHEEIKSDLKSTDIIEYQEEQKHQLQVAEEQKQQISSLKINSQDLFSVGDINSQKRVRPSDINVSQTKTKSYQNGSAKENLSQDSQDSHAKFMMAYKKVALEPEDMLYVYGNRSKEKQSQSSKQTFSNLDLNEIDLNESDIEDPKIQLSEDDLI